MAKHFTLDIGEATFTYQRQADSIAAEAALDGLYVIRTSVAAQRLDSADCVRHYKALANADCFWWSFRTPVSPAAPPESGAGARVDYNRSEMPACAGIPDQRNTLRLSLMSMERKC